MRLFVPAQIITIVKVSPLVQLSQLPQPTLESLFPRMPVDRVRGFEVVVFLQYLGLIVVGYDEVLQIPFELGLVDVKKRTFVGR